jgi:hypothetical protein
MVDQSVGTECGSSGKYSVAPELGGAWLAVGRLS